MPEDSGTNILNIKHGNTAKMPQLPPVAIDSMSQVGLLLYSCYKNQHPMLKYLAFRVLIDLKAVLFL